MDKHNLSDPTQVQRQVSALVDRLMPPSRRIIDHDIAGNPIYSDDVFVHWQEPQP